MSASTDRELLEFAAKAAGLTTLHKWNAERLFLNPPVAALVVHHDGELVSTGWNPLDDDGNALRLAISLNIEVRFNTNEDEKTTTAILPSPDNPESGEGWTFTQGWRGDKEGATRRAIVQAAAAAGRAAP